MHDYRLDEVEKPGRHAAATKRLTEPPPRPVSSQASRPAARLMEGARPQAEASLWGRPDPSLLGAPQPRRLTGVAVDAGLHRCCLAFFVYVVAAISDEGPGMAIGQVATICAAKRDRAAVVIEGPRFVGNLAVADEGAQVFGGSLPSGPSIGARLAQLGRGKKTPALPSGARALR